MKGVLLSGFVALATMVVFTECVPNSRVKRADPTCQDVANVMPVILASMIRYGPKTNNANLNKFILVITDAGDAAAKSPTGQINQVQFADFSSRGLITICAATNTSKTNIEILKALLKQGMKMSPNQNMDTFMKMMGQVVCYLGDGSKASSASVNTMFMNFYTTAPKTEATNTGSKATIIDRSKLKTASKGPAPKLPAKPSATIKNKVSKSG